MSFFTELAAISEGLDLTIRIKQKNGKLTVSVLPDKIDKVQPLITTGTPEQLDAEFIGAITKPLAETKLVINQAEYEKSLKKPAPAKAATKGKGKKATEEDEDSEGQEAADAEKIAKAETKGKPKKKTQDKKKPIAKPESSKEKEPEGPKQLSIG